LTQFVEIESVDAQAQPITTLDREVAVSSPPELLMLAMPKISVVMPAYNEETHVAQCIKRMKSHLQTLTERYELIVVDDGSTDATRREAEKMAENPHVRVVGYTRNQGKGFAVKYGTEYASGDVVIFTDSDKDIDPHLIERYVTLLKHYDIIISSKYHPESRISAPVMRRFLSLCFRALVILLTGLRVSDTQSGLKAFRTEALRRTLSLICVKRFAFDVELLVAAKLCKLRIAELPIRIEMNNLFSVRHVVRMAVDLMGVAYRLRVIRWYQTNLHNSRPKYDPIIKW
jgi:glycosyltransferase involved in cell wall biosynthesis